MRDTDKMPFGAHKDKAMANVPTDYLLYVYTQDWIKNWPEVKKYCEDNLDVLEHDYQVNKKAKHYR